MFYFGFAALKCYEQFKKRFSPAFSSLSFESELSCEKNIYTFGNLNAAMLLGDFRWCPKQIIKAERGLRNGAYQLEKFNIHQNC